MGSLCISPDELVSEAGVVTEGDFEALCRMEITFKRKKGEYFACYDFGTAITPDSDQMVRIGTLAMIRLMLRCGAFRACYGKLDVDAPARAAAVRAKVADPCGFSGLEIDDTGYGSFADLVAACREDGWVLDAAALDRPLFPGIDEATGCFLFTETFEADRLCKRVIATAGKLGMNKHKVGAWSFGKDACEQPAAAGDGEVAARVLGHRHVNSRTMDRVYRADLRTRDLGAYWMRREALASVQKRPLTSQSASRVPAASGVRGFADVPAGAERDAALNDALVAEAAAELARVRGLLEERLGVAAGALPRQFKKRVRELEGENDVADYEALQAKRKQAVQAAQDVAVEAYRLRVYKEGQEELRTTPALKVAMQSTHTWASRSENDAIAFGLDRKDRTRELAMLRKLPATLQGSLLSVGALHVLPIGGTPAQVYERVARRCDGLCALRCTSEACADAPDIEWPGAASAFAALRCEGCGSAPQLHWLSETPEGSEKVPLAVGAEAAVGKSFVESYGVWYNSCARATIGNAAYEAGRDATATRSGTIQDVAARARSNAVQEVASDKHVIEAIVDERSVGRGAKRREYRVRWRGYDPSWEAWRISGAVGTPIETWEPERGVRDTEALLEWRARGASQSVHGGSEVWGGGSVEAMAAMMEADEVAALMADEVLDLSQEV